MGACFSHQQDENKESQIPEPLIISKGVDAIDQWLAWKKCFKNYVDKEQIPPCLQVDCLKRYIGFLGNQIKDNFYVYNYNDIHSLLFKYDVYFMCYSDKKREESIDYYCRYLEGRTHVVQSKINQDIDKIIKEKLLQDMKKDEIFERSLVTIPEFRKIKNYEELTKRELIFLWKESELTHLHGRGNNQRNRNNRTGRCPNCNYIHKGTPCLAEAQQCTWCRQFNHLPECCPNKQCVYCGSHHTIGANFCPAHGNQCSFCKNRNHFSWKCIRNYITNCTFCGQGHVPGINYCPARTSICSNCRRQGHYTYKCRSRRRN